MKKLLPKLPVVVLVCFISPSSAQNVEPVLASITYKFIHVNDTTKPGEPLVTDMILRVGKTNCKYNNATMENVIKQSQPTQEEIAATPQHSLLLFQGAPMAVVKNISINTGVFFQIPGKNKLIHTANVGVKDYLMESQLPTIDWKIENDVRIIADHSCQKAVGYYAGRSYIAWFATDLPFSYGPWKLWGLPGLILEAHDSKNEVQFLFQKISKESGDEQIMSGAYRPVKVSEEAFAKAQKNFNQDPEATVSAQAGLGAGSFNPGIYYQDATGKMISGDAARSAIKQELKRRTNNPLELTRN